MTYWTEEEIRIAIRELGKVARPELATDALSAAFGRRVTTDAVQKAFRRRSLGAPGAYCAGRPGRDTIPPAPFAVSFQDEPRPAEDASPAAFEVAPMPSPAQTKPDCPAALSVAPRARAKRHRVAVVSDPHLGSKYTLRAELRSFVEDAYADGVREFLLSGDVLEGAYEHAKWEVSHAGFDAQLEDLYETWPHLPGANVRMIAGNHDETFFKAAGIDACAHLVNFFKARGRHDFHAYGMRDALLRVHGATVNLYHPSGGGGLGAHVNRLIAKVNGYAPELKVDILIAGHWHDFAVFEHRGTQCIVAPTFQGSGGPFGNTFTKKPSIGGLTLSWSLDEQGRMRDFAVDRRIVREASQIHVLDCA